MLCDIINLLEFSILNVEFMEFKVYCDAEMTSKCFHKEKMCTFLIINIIINNGITFASKFIGQSSKCDLLEVHFLNLMLTIIPSITNIEIRLISL